MKICLKLLFAMLLSPVVLAQGVSIGNGSGSPGGSAIVDLGYAQQNNIRSFQIVIEYDNAILTPQNTSGSVNGCPVDLSGVNWDPTLTNCLVVVDPQGSGEQVLSITGSSGGPSGSPPLEALAPFGTVTFDIDNNAPIGSTPVALRRVAQAFASGSNTNDPSLLSVTDGVVTIEGPQLTFDPVGDGADANRIDAGSAPVGTTVSPIPASATIDVSETGTEDVILDSCGPPTGTHGSDFSISYAGFDEPLPATFPGDATVETGTLTVGCTPGGSGTRTGEVSCSVQDSLSNEIATPTWQLTCEGLVPNLQVSQNSFVLSATAGNSDDGVLTVTNSGGAAADPANLVLTSADTTEISVVEGLSSPISAGGDDQVTFRCAPTSAGVDVTETFEVQYDDLGSGNSPTETVTVRCTDTAPIYNSVPTEATGVDFGAVQFDTTEAVTIDVFNDNPNGDNLNITSMPTVTGDGFQLVRYFAGPYPGASGADGENDPSGGGDIVVSCTPPGVGQLAGTLTVETNSADTPHTYDLTCQGDGLPFTVSPDVNETLNLGTVPPGTQTPVGSIDLTNNLISGSGGVQFSCTIQGGDTAEISAVGATAISVAPQDTGSIEYQCTPSAVGNFSVDVACDAVLPQGAGRGTQNTHTVSCAGRPLVVPTMSRWGLVVMSLVLLMVAGVAGRRMLA